MDDDLSVTSDELVFIRIAVPELSVELNLQFGRSELVWHIKQQCLSSLPKDLKEGFNYGLFYPPQNGKAGKFLDEARPIADYPFSEPVGYLELKYKRRVYKMLKLDERQLKAAHSRANLKRFLEYVHAGHADKVAKLCAKGLDPNFHCPETGETPLTLTARLPRPSRMILTLVNGGAIVDYRTIEGLTALHRSVQTNNPEALNTLLDLGASPNYQDAKGLTPLYHSIVNNADPGLTQALLHDHATIGAQDTQGWAEVHQAARRSMTQHLEHLLFYGADMHTRNASGNTPLHVCAINGEEACARVLLFRGSDRQALNFANQTPYQVAVIAGNLDLAEVIQRHRPEDVVPFKEAPKYNPRRRASALPRTPSDWRLGSPMSKPPSPSPSNRSLPPFSSASSLSEASTGSSGTCTQPTSDADPAILHGTDLLDVVSESSGVGTSHGSGSGSGSGESSDPACLVLPSAGCTVVCIESYSGSPPGHLSIIQGDLIEVLASTDSGLLEGCVAGQVGLFPSRCVQEVRLRTSPPASVPPPAAAIPRPDSQLSGSQLSTSQLSTSQFSGSQIGTSQFNTSQFSTSQFSTSQLNTSQLSASQLSASQLNYAPRELNSSHYGTTPRHRRAVTLQPRTVVLHRSNKGFGFVLRGAKSSSPLMELRPSERCPALQYLDDVDPGGVAERAGLKKWDFILAINSVDVSQASHELVVEHIRKAGDLVAMTVVSLPEPLGGALGGFSTLPRQLSAPSVTVRPPIPPLPPKRDPKTTLSVGRARARSMFNNYPELEALDRAIHDYDSEGRSTNSSSLDSDTYKVPSVKVASIRTRPTSSRLTSRELEEMFARQGSAPQYPPTAGQGGPRVYASVAEMKRHKGKKPKGGTSPMESVYVGDSGSLKSLRKGFHSTPDLQNMAEAGQRRRSHSQEDLHAMQAASGVPRALSIQQLYRQRSTEDTSSETSEEPSLRGLRRPRHLRGGSRGRGRSPGGASESEYAVPPTDGPARRVPSTFRPTTDAKLYASPTELRTLAFQDTADAATLRRRQQQRSRSVPARPECHSEPVTPTPGGEPATPTLTPTYAPAAAHGGPLSQVYARPQRRPQPVEQEEDFPPPPPSLLELKPPPSPRSRPPPGPASPAASPGSEGSHLQAMLAEKVAERRRRLSVGELHTAAPLSEDSALPPPPPPAAYGSDGVVEQITRIQLAGKKPPSTTSGIPGPSKTGSPARAGPGMTKSHTIGSLSGDDLRAARSKLRSAKSLSQQPAAAHEDGDNSSSGVSSDQDQAQPKYVTFIPTEGSPFTRRQDESEESESSDDTSDRTWILSSAGAAQQAAQHQAAAARPGGGDARARSSSIPCLASSRARTAGGSALQSSLSSKAAGTRPVSIVVPGGRPAPQQKQLRFGGTTTVVITAGSSPEPDQSSPEQAAGGGDEQSIQRSLQAIEQHAGELATSQMSVPPPPGFEGGLVIAPPPEFCDMSAMAAESDLPPPAKVLPRTAPKPGTADAGGSRLVKPKTLGLRSRLPGATSPPATSPVTSPTPVASPPGSVTSPRSGIPRPGGGIPRLTSKIPAPGGSPTKIPGALRGPRTNTSQPTPSHVKNGFRNLYVSRWTVTDTCDWLESLFMSEYKQRFAEAGVDGAQLLQLDGTALAELGVRRMGHRINIDKALKRLTAPSRSPAR